MNENLSPQPLTTQQVERIRLLLSTYQDGTGQLKLKKHTDTLPDWRQFERAVAVAMGGSNTESKAVFDVLMPANDSEASAFGISCKMRGELRAAHNKGIVTVEVSNAAGEFWDELRAIGIETTPQMVGREAEAGKAVLDLVARWESGAKQAHQLSLAASYYLVLLWNNTRLDFQLFQMALSLPDPTTLTWTVRISRTEAGSGCLVGSIGERRVIEWYGNSGGQLKYYPEVAEALWKSDVFRLEPLPFSEDGYGIAQKARTFFPELWARATDDTATSTT